MFQDQLFQPFQLVLCLAPPQTHPVPVGPKHKRRKSASGTQRAGFGAAGASGATSALLTQQTCNQTEWTETWCQALQGVCVQTSDVGPVGGDGGILVWIPRATSGGVLLLTFDACRCHL